MSLDNELCIINDEYKELTETLKLLESLKSHKSNPVNDIETLITETKQKLKQVEKKQANISSLLAEWASSLVE